MGAGRLGADDAGGGAAVRLLRRRALQPADRAALSRRHRLPWLAANQVPDHTTIARFHQTHGQALGGLFVAVLRLCVEAGMVQVGVVALDGTKLHANASREANRDRDQIDAEVERMLAEAARVDAAEDERFGNERGDELPPGLRQPTERLASYVPPRSDSSPERAHARSSTASGCVHERPRTRVGANRVPPSRSPGRRSPSPTRRAG